MALFWGMHVLNIACLALARQRRSNQNLIGSSKVRATMVWAVARPTNPDLSLHGCMHRTQTQTFSFFFFLFLFVCITVAFYYRMLYFFKIKFGL
jgi:hypothetical protein